MLLYKETIVIINKMPDLQDLVIRQLGKNANDNKIYMFTATIILMSIVKKQAESTITSLPL